MTQIARRLLADRSETLLREALGLAGLSVAILAVLYLPLLA